MLNGRSLTSVTTGMPASLRRSTAALISGASGALRMTPREPRLAIVSSTLTMSLTWPFSRKSNRERTTAGRSEGSSCSSAALTAEENRSGVCITMSIMNTRPLSRSWLRCRSRSAMACLMSLTVLGRTPPRWLRTRSTVASLTPAWRAISRIG